MTWQPWHERALKSGPSPSEEAVEAGAATQGRVNTPLPTKKSARASKPSAPEGCEKAFASARACEVPDPPCSTSNGSGAAKPVAGASRRARRSAGVSGLVSAPAPALAGIPAPVSAEISAPVSVGISASVSDDIPAPVSADTGAGRAARASAARTARADMLPVAPPSADVARARPGRAASRAWAVAAGRIAFGMASGGVGGGWVGGRGEGRVGVGGGAVRWSASGRGGATLPEHRAGRVEAVGALHRGPGGAEGGD